MRIDTSALSAGELLLWRSGVIVPDDIDLDELAAVEGVEVRYRALDGCEARLVVQGDRGIISVKQDRKSLGRQRFSLAHELAHWMCDRGLGGRLCAADDISPSNTEARSRESEANVYASQLVLPDYLAAPLSKALPFTLDGAQELAKAFRSSLTAAALKLVRHSERPTALVCHKPTGSFWFRKSKSFPLDAFIARELHHDSPAFALMYGTEGGRTKPHSEPASRWIPGYNKAGKDARCQSMKMPNGSVLSALELLG